jgi:hypothetical protein
MATPSPLPGGELTVKSDLHTNREKKKGNSERADGKI